MAKNFKELTEREILALAITLEEEHSRIYGDIAENMKANYPGTTQIFADMQTEEKEHHARLVTMYRSKFGDHIPLIRRHDVKGFVSRPPIWMAKNLGVDRVRKLAASMELETRLFYERAATRASDVTIRQLLLDLAEAERAHVTAAEQSEARHLTDDVRRQEDTAKRRLLVLQVIQPGLAGLMDGSVSTLAPLFAAAFAAAKLASGGGHYDSWFPFKIGLAAAVGAGISMGFAEALSDDGSLTGRGRPLIRGVVCGLMTTAGGIGHTLPFLIPHFRIAFWLAIIVVAIELAAIAWIRHRYMESPWVVATLQVILGGIIVLLAGILIGS
jgi:erythrin-vacuolar iron transport family protein